jgi:hypothetical protein
MKPRTVVRLIGRASIAAVAIVPVTIAGVALIHCGCSRAAWTFFDGFTPWRSAPRSGFWRGQKHEGLPLFCRTFRTSANATASPNPSALGMLTSPAAMRRRSCSLALLP